MTCNPEITILKNSTNTNTGGILQQSTATVTFLVNYCGACEEGTFPPDVPYQVLEDINGTSWDIVVGRPLAQIDPDTFTRTPWLKAYSADMTAAEVASVNAGDKPYAYYYVTNYSCNLVEPANPDVWLLTVNLAMMTVENSSRYPHCTVNIETVSRMARAWRIGPGTSSSPFKVPTTNVGTGVTGPFLPPHTTLTDPPSGRYDPKAWRGQVSGSMDVFGSDIDINGNPMSVAIEQIKHSITAVLTAMRPASTAAASSGMPFSITFVARKPYLGLIPATGADAFYKNTGWVDWAQSASCYLNKRNDATMWGYLEGELVCDSVSVSDINEQFSQVTLTFTWDEWGHFDQQMWSDSGTLGGLSNQNYVQTGTVDRPIETALAVFWTTSYHEAFNVAEINAKLPMAVWSVATEAFYKPTCYYPEVAP